MQRVTLGLVSDRNNDKVNDRANDGVALYRTSNDVGNKVKHFSYSSNPQLSPSTSLLRAHVRNYPIHFTKENDVYTIHAPQIDSALLLLPVYRDMVEYDKKSNTWSVERVYAKKK